MVDNQPQWTTAKEMLQFLSEHLEDVEDLVLIWTDSASRAGSAYHCKGGMYSVLGMLEAAKFSNLHDEVHTQDFLRGMRN